MSDITGFRKDLNKFAEKIGVQVEVAIKKIALQTFTGIVKKTPVDKGRARASWVIGVEQIDTSRPFGPNTKFTESEATLQAFKELRELSKIKPTSTVFISNSLPYILRLEKGSSKQAPEGMVEVTLAEVGRDIKRIEREFK